MSYQITLTNKTALTTVADGEINTTATDIALVGRGATNYGLLMNDNLVHLLENFANPTPPPNAIKGQLWYDSSVNILKVHNGRDFVVTNGTFIGQTAPTGITAGGLWVDTSTNQLYFNNGIENILAGPIFTSAQGTSGFVTRDVLDIYQIQHTIVLLYVGSVLLGIFSKDAFTPAQTIAGYSGSVSIGFNASAFSGIGFNVNASSASAIVDASGNLKYAESFLSTTEDSSTTGTLNIQNTLPLVLGDVGSEISVTNSLFKISTNAIGQDFEIETLSGNAVESAIYVDSQNSRVGIFNNTPQQTLDINGTVLIEGNLIVNGTTTSTNTSTIDLENLTITMADTPNATDLTANGAGLIVKGATDHTWLWSNTVGWNSSESINLATGKSFTINGTPVLTSTGLGPQIVNIPGTLTGISVLGNVKLNNLAMANNQISYSNPAYVNGDIVLVPKGTGTINVSNAKIVNVGTPLITDPGNYAANKNYVDTSLRSRSLSATLEVTGFTNTQISGVYLSRLFPTNEHENGSICRTICTDMAITGGLTAGPGASPANPMVLGNVYMIVNAGNTDFTQCGASANTPGTVFVATAYGTGTGVANPVVREFALLSGVWTYQGNS